MPGAKVEALTNRIVAALRDAANDGWPETAIHDAILEAERIITIYRPDATSVDTNFTCAAGIRQSIEGLTSPVALRFLDAKYNVVNGSPDRAIRLVEQISLDRIRPNWRREAQQSSIKEVMFDPRLPTVFYNYPPVQANSVIRIAYSASPSFYDTIDSTTETTVSDVFEPNIIECALYRLLGHDVEGSVNVNRSQQHWSNFQQMMGVKIESERAFGPKNPAHKR